MTKWYWSQDAEEAEWNKQAWGKRNTQVERLQNIKPQIINLWPELKSQRDTERNEPKLGQWSFRCRYNCLQCLCCVNLFGRQRGKQKGNEINRKKQREASDNNKQLLTEVNGAAAGGGACSIDSLVTAAIRHGNDWEAGLFILALISWWHAGVRGVQRSPHSLAGAPQEALESTAIQNTPTNSFFARCQAKTGSGPAAAVEEKSHSCCCPVAVCETDLIANNQTPANGVVWTRDSGLTPGFDSPRRDSNFRKPLDLHFCHGVANQ